MKEKLADFFNKAKIFVKHNWKGAMTFVVIIVAIAVMIVLCEIYQYLALNVWATVK